LGRLHDLGARAPHPDDRVLVCISGVSSFWFQNQVRKLDRVLDIEQISRIKEGSKRREELRRWVAVMECFLFGDGVFAAVLSNKPKQGLEVKNVVEVSNVEAGDCAAGYSQLVALDEPFRFGFFSHLDKEIPNLGAKYTTIALERLFGKEKGELEKARKWAVHTGSQKILQRLSEQHNIAAEKLLESREVLAEYGNLAGASLPFIIEKIMAHRSLKKGDLILMVGYGWGFTAAAGTLEYTG
ncbi:MAG: 3-oxoacyl-[acyl-carrier-protein] synthase III C-terminal domain-containing protein, partial [Candidatus Bathyarchaeia archaeon]